MKAKLWLLLILCFSAVHAKDLGVHGNVYPIVEEDLLQVMKARAMQMEQKGALGMINETLVNDVTQKLTNADTALHLKKTQKERIYYLNLTDSRSQINKNDVPDYLTIKATLLFIDATDESQLEWALRQEDDNKKIILVKGDAIALIQTHGTKFYIDQEGVLIKRLGIQHVPAKVSGDKEWLKIHEVKL